MSNAYILSCAKTMHNKTTHLQRQIALMREKREKNHIPKEQCPQQSHSSPPASQGDRCWLPRGQGRDSHIGEAAPAPLASWRESRPGSRSQSRCSAHPQRAARRLAARRRPCSASRRRPLGRGKEEGPLLSIRESATRRC
jgi:hypothetical protein